MATSPGHKESGNTSNHPNRDRQSTSVMQPPSMQHIQSMVAVMEELTRQNQELTREIGLRRQRHEGYVEGRPRAKKLEEKMLSLRTNQEVPLCERCCTWRRRWIR